MGGTTPVVLFEHNVEYMIWQRLCALETRPWRRALFEIEWRKLRAREADACRAGRPHDRRLGGRSAPPRSARARHPRGVDSDRRRHELLHARRPAASAPTASCSAARWTGIRTRTPSSTSPTRSCRASAPRSPTPRSPWSAAIPTARLREVAARAGIDVTGTVDDVRPSIGEAAVYVVPLRAGGGTRLKIFEALAMAKPVVSTTVGAEGLALEDRTPLRRRRRPGRVCRLRSSRCCAIPSGAGALGQAGRDLVEAYYSWPTIAREFEQRCEEVVAAACTRTGTGRQSCSSVTSRIASTAKGSRRGWRAP